MARELKRDRMMTLQGAVGRAALAGVVLAALAAGAAAAADRSESFYAAHVYTETRTTLIWDGKPVVVEGSVHCERNANFNAKGDLWFGMLDHRPPMYDCSPEWLATRLDDGSALLVGAYGVAGGWRRDGADEPVGIDAMREHLAKVPRAVIWLDDPVNPTRGEYYFSSIALDDPRSRLTAISTELVSVSRGSMVLGALFGKTPSDPAKVVPWLGGDPDPRFLVAAYAAVATEEIWSKVPSFAKELGKFEKPGPFPHTRYPWEDRVKIVRAIGFDAFSFKKVLLVPKQPSTGNEYEHSKHVCPLRKDGDLFRIEIPCMKGMMPFFAHDEKLGADGRKVLRLELSNKVTEEENQYVWGDFFFDPVTMNLYLIYSVHLNPKLYSLR